MKLSEFDYNLPPGSIAQEPAPRRDASRLLVMDRATGALRDGVFSELPGLLRPGDLLVLNDTRVRPARLLARKPGGGRAEALLLERIDPGGEEERVQEWKALVRGFPGAAGGGGIAFPGGLNIVLLGREPGGEVARVRVEGREPVSGAMEAHGRTPLPPYIRREEGDPREASDRERYQTVYAGPPGAVAAPTAGLHFTRELLEAITRMGVAVEPLTLHVGWGTFQPVRTESLEEHRMHAERFSVPARLAAAVGRIRERGGRVVAVGTTVVRALEGAAASDGAVRAGEGECDLFIRPGHRFRVVDGLVTNFHLPRSTLLVLVSAFAGRERILAAYRHAVSSGYRFYSYGDAMVIL